jgi:DnaJ like chaperone protein
MGKFGKWIAGGLGWAFLGPIGGIVGFFLGSLLEQSGKEYTPGSTTPGDFAISLLVLVAAVMKADGKVLRSELDFVKTYFVQIFGKQAATEAVKMLRDLLNQNIPVHDVCMQIGRQLDYPSRLQLLHFLFGLAIADGQVHESELKLILKIADSMGIRESDKQSVHAMFVKDTSAAYKILEVDESASEEEVKKAYRQLAKLHHPDKVTYLGDDMKREAEKKFQKINEAYDTIKKERGWK